MSRPFLTIIVPAYNEAQRLPHSLAKIATFLRAQSFTTEILVVENRSTDETSEVVLQLRANSRSLRSIYVGTASQCAWEGGSGKDGDARRKGRLPFYLRCRSFDAH